jgi:hypothetical protein
MPLDLKAVQLGTATVTVKYADGEFDVNYYPHRLTGPVNRKIVESTDDPELGGLDEAILHLVKSWTLTEGTKAWPLEAERIAELPVMLKVRICNAMVGEITAPLSGATSPDTSSPAAG